MEMDELFVRVPIKILLDDRVSRSALIVYAVLLDAAGKWSIVTDLTVAEISERAGISEKSVRRAEAQLVDAGYLAIHRTGRASMIEVLHNLRPLRCSSVEFYKSKEGSA